MNARELIKTASLEKSKSSATWKALVGKIMKPKHLILFHAIFCLACLTLIASLPKSSLQPRLPQLASIRLTIPFPGDFTYPGLRAYEMEKK